MAKFSKARYSRGWIVLLATLIGLSYGGYTYVHRAITAQVYIENCGHVDYKPKVILKFCADAGVGIADIDWTQWSASQAEGTAKYSANDCNPTCVAGKFSSAEVYVKLSKLKKINGKDAFTYIQVETKDGTPLPLLKSKDDQWSLEMAG